MPSLTLPKRAAKPDKGAIYIALESAAVGEIPVPLRRGERLRGDNPLVLATWPSYWIEDGATDDETAAARAALLAPLWAILPPEDPSQAVQLPVRARSIRRRPSNSRDRGGRSQSGCCV